MAIFICCVAWIVPGSGQSLPEWLAKDGAPKPPDFGIRDQGGFFSKDSGAFKRISDRLRKLEEERGYKIFLMIEPVLIGTNATQLAAELRQLWLPDGPGMVVVFESDSRTLGIGRDLTVLPEMTGPVGLIPTHETAALIDRAVAEVDATLAPEPFIEGLMGNLVAGCEDYFSRRAAPLPAGRSLRISLLVIGALALLALGGIGMAWFVRNSGMADVRSFRFPAVDRPERLGAPCGTNVTTRRFATKSSLRP